VFLKPGQQRFPIKKRPRVLEEGVPKSFGGRSMGDGGKKRNERKMR
jgi:hypothetical protein